MSKLYAVLAAGAAMVASVPAQAVTLIASYTISNGSGTIRTSLAFDPYGTVNDVTPLSYSYSGTQTVFNQAVAFDAVSAIDSTEITLGGLPRGSATSTAAGSIGNNDFRFIINIRRDGTPFQPQGSLLTNGQVIASTSLGGGNSFSIFNISLDGVSAVPEPSTWAMSIIGFGVLGAALRRRRPAGSLLRA